jgi:glycosyltransferase involved in cell wall biosynthesis/MOSC domain-containing protein YiiM
MKTLLVLPPERGHLRLDLQRQKEAAGECPQESLFEEALNADIVDAQYLQDWQSRSLFTRFFYKIIPLLLLQALIVYQQRRRYDVVISWDDRFALIYAFLLRLTRSRSRHVAILSWMSPPKKAFALKLFQKGIDRIVLWSQTQCDLLVEFFKISPARIVVVPYWVDQNFWWPMNETTDSICSVGDSRRDYATLIEAVRGLDIRCNIATRVKLAETANCDWGATSRSLAQVSSLPDNVVCQSASFAELRAMYARAKFVVVPLLPTFRDSGITVVTEAMAMGKAIICSRIQGQIEFLEEGVTGMFVPPGDVQALREAIQYLWDHPNVAAQMGREGRRRAEEVFALTQFVTNVRQIVDDVITGNRTPIPIMAERMRELRRSKKEVAAGSVRDLGGYCTHPITDSIRISTISAEKSKYMTKLNEKEYSLLRVVGIYTSPSQGKPMVAHKEVTVIEGKGIVGDRYFLDICDGYYNNSHDPNTERVMTLISVEGIEEGNKILQEMGGTPLRPEETRRNLVVSVGLDALNELIEQEFEVGGIRMRGVVPSLPCWRPPSLLGRPEDIAPFVKAFLKTSGIRAIPLTSGVIREGDPVVLPETRLQEQSLVKAGEDVS